MYLSHVVLLQATWLGINARIDVGSFIELTRGLSTLPCNVGSWILLSWLIGSSRNVPLDRLLIASHFDHIVIALLYVSRLTNIPLLTGRVWVLDGVPLIDSWQLVGLFGRRISRHVHLRSLCVVWTSESFVALLLQFIRRTHVHRCSVLLKAIEITHRVRQLVLAFFLGRLEALQLLGIR